MNQTNPLPEWTDDLSVNVDTIDEDHQAFFRLAALMYEVASTPNNEQFALIETAINILEEYVEGHFLREQMAMATADYAYMAEHIAAHDAFADRVNRVIQTYRETGDIEHIRALSALVAEWLNSHIRVVDAQYKGILTNANVDDRPLVYMAAGLDTEFAS
ncbi:hemerythrin [Paramagnetospirillum kuznetsovii]|uniref:Hemerythrin n=1 Tax=Paramagnetospirillum kuznetsovii TaxID=2053833 RepID=A0A364NSP2_9PROT|nr:hemerythrin family protein [Paramagnetospirillum kuznetsovii]RAU20084.1 hemerythrin [Paramagnetospirillum kuznetsovii]